MQNKDTRLEVCQMINIIKLAFSLDWVHPLNTMQELPHSWSLNPISDISFRLTQLFEPPQKEHNLDMFPSISSAVNRIRRYYILLISSVLKSWLNDFNSGWNGKWWSRHSPPPPLLPNINFLIYSRKLGEGSNQEVDNLALETQAILNESFCFGS